MGAEPEDIAAVEGDKPEACSRCGGPCTRVRDDTLAPDQCTAGYRYESLVKGEVVAEGWARHRYDGHWEFFSWSTALPGLVSAVLVIRAAREENARTGGKQ